MGKLKSKIRIKKHKVYQAIHKKLKEKLRVSLDLFRQKNKGIIREEIIQKAEPAQIDQKSCTYPFPNPTTPQILIPTHIPMNNEDQNPHQEPTMGVSQVQLNQFMGTDITGIIIQWIIDLLNITNMDRPTLQMDLILSTRHRANSKILWAMFQI